MIRSRTTIDLERIIFVLQKKDKETGEWKTQPTHFYTGKSDSRIALQNQRKNNPNEEWRALTKQEAERYREGWQDAMRYIDTEFELEPDDADHQTSNSKDVVSAAGSSNFSPRSK